MVICALSGRAGALLALGVWAAETASAANCPQRSIFCRFLGKYPDIHRRNRQKLSSLGSIFASTRSAAQTPRGRKRPIPNPVSFFSVRAGPCRSLLIESITKFVDKSGAALSPRRATHLSLASPRESKQREGDPGVCVPPLRCGQPAVLGPAGVSCKLAALKQARALIRLALRSSAHSQGF